jgi:hypothetical protein
LLGDAAQFLNSVWVAAMLLLNRIVYMMIPFCLIVVHICEIHVLSVVVMFDGETLCVLLNRRP